MAELGFFGPQYAPMTTGSFMGTVTSRPRMGHSCKVELLNKGRPAILICSPNVMPSASVLAYLLRVAFKEERMPK